MNFNRLSAYRVMWTIVMYDLPTETKQQRKAAAKFRKQLLQGGFTMFQFSMYIRYATSAENAASHLRRIKRFLPTNGKIGIMQITDKQFSQIEIFYGTTQGNFLHSPEQLTLF